MILNNENPDYHLFQNWFYSKSDLLLAWTALFLLNVYCIIEFFFCRYCIKTQVSVQLIYSCLCVNAILNTKKLLILCDNHSVCLQFFALLHYLLFKNDEILVESYSPPPGHTEVLSSRQEMVQELMIGSWEFGDLTVLQKCLQFKAWQEPCKRSRLNGVTDDGSAEPRLFRAG